MLGIDRESERVRERKKKREERGRCSVRFGTDRSKQYRDEKCS